MGRLMTVGFHITQQVEVMIESSESNLQTLTAVVAELEDTVLTSHQQQNTENLINCSERK